MSSPVVTDEPATAPAQPQQRQCSRSGCSNILPPESDYSGKSCTRCRERAKSYKAKQKEKEENSKRKRAEKGEGHSEEAVDDGGEEAGSSSDDERVSQQCI